MTGSRAPGLYRLLLRALPGTFRREFGREMEALFVERLREAGRSRGARLSVWLSAGLDVLTHGLAERVGRRPTRNAPVGPRRASLPAELVREAGAAVRGLLRAPGYTAVAVLMLSLGLGASVAIYSLLHGVVLSSLQYPEADRLVRLKTLAPGVGAGTEWNLSWTQFFFFGEQSRTIETIGVYPRGWWGSGNVETPGGAEYVVAANVSAGTLELIGARASAGRLMNEREYGPGASPVIVLSHGFWQRRFGGDPGVIGTTLRVHGQPHEVIGIMEAGVELPPERGGGPGVQSDIWAPIRHDPAVASASHTLPVIARLRPGVRIEDAQAELDRLTARLREAFPETYPPRLFERFGLRTKVYALKPYVLGDLTRSLWIVFGGAGLVLVIACANVANLLLVRVEARRQDMAIRAALGAGRGAIARHLLMESLVLSLASGAMALFVGHIAVRGVLALASDPLPRVPASSMSVNVAMFTASLSFLVAMGLTAAPLAQHRRRGSRSSLLEGGRSITVGRARQRVRSMLVVIQVALALVLLTGAGLLIESSRRMRALDPGIDPAGVITAGVNLPSATYADAAAVWRFYGEVLERVRVLPGVTAAGMTNELPFTGGFGCTAQRFEDREVEERLSATGLTACAGQVIATDGYFESLGIPLLRGRPFEERDNAGGRPGVVVVSRAFADRFWPGEDPIGKGVAPPRAEAPFHRVVGVVGDVYSTSVIDEPAPVVYYPVVMAGVETWRPSAMRLVVRTRSADPASLLPLIRRIVADVDPGIPLVNEQTMGALADQALSRISFISLLLGIAASFALLLAAVGLFGVISYIVTLRTAEIGVRMALGAPPGRIRAEVIGGSLRLAGLGLVVGLLAASAATRVLRNLLFGVATTDPFAYGIAAALLVTVATLAAALPARRASKIDPIRALQNR